MCLLVAFLCVLQWLSVCNGGFSVVLSGFYVCVFIVAIIVFKWLFCVTFSGFSVSLYLSGFCVS